MSLALHHASFALQANSTSGAQRMPSRPPSGTEPLHSVARTIDQLAPRLPLALVSPAAGSRLMRVAAALPAALTSWIYLECRLQRGEERVDLIVRVDQHARDILTGDNPVIALGAGLYGHSSWRGVRALARAWADPSSALHRGVERLWLEFDVHAAPGITVPGTTVPGTIVPGTTAPGALPAPGVFIEFAREVYAQHSKEDRARVAMAALRPLFSDAMMPETARNLRRCWELLPSGATIPYVGLFPARGSGAVRVSVAGLGDAELPAYLRALRWPGSHRELTSAVSAFLPSSRVARPRMAIANLDVGQSFGTGVGLEYVLSHASQLRGYILEREFIEHLVRSGLCSASKGDALTAWLGRSFMVMPHELWRSRVVRRVNHIKLAFAGDRPLEAKAYLSASHEYHPAREAADRATVRLQHSTR